MNITIQGLPTSLSPTEISFKNTFIENFQSIQQTLLTSGPENCKEVNVLIKVSLEQPSSIEDRLSLNYYPENCSQNVPPIIRAKLSVMLQAYIKKSIIVQKIDCFILFDTAIDAVKIIGEADNSTTSKSVKDTRSDEEKFEFHVTQPKYSLEQMVLNESLEKEIKIALMTISNRKKIYEDWGFSEIDGIPKAILNFFGPPGTGKTMAAHAIANYNNSSILALNYSEIESKYVGDAPKKLMQAFDLATKEKAVLFFDEADSFLGKRISDVSSSSDQAINSLRSQLLILLENFEGIVIFATNLVGNYDKAFESRILKHLKFDLPDENLRKSIIRKMIPLKAPIEDGHLTDLQLEELAKASDGLAGRQIKNSILDALTSAAFNNEQVIAYKYFRQGFENTKINLGRLQQETGSNISFEIKEQLEKRIQENLALDEQKV